MPRPRKSLICLQDTPYYHCISRCVRRAFLCSEDHYSKKSYEHRRQWVEARLIKLGSIFAINVCAYAVMSNHTHVVLHVDRDEALSWTTHEVLKRWHTLHKGTNLTRQYMQAEQRSLLSDSQIESVIATANIYRQRLHDISWFMRLLNEFIARLANKEDECTGRFWEGRFKSQSLLDEAALAACMAYVDLNPLRVGLSQTPEQSDFTSIKKRVAAAKIGKQPQYLQPFSGSGNALKGLPFLLDDYLELVDKLGKKIRSDQNGYISNIHSPILDRTGLQNIDWEGMCQGIETQFSSSISLSIAIRRQKILETA